MSENHTPAVVAAQTILTQGLRRQDSAFAPGRRAWSPETTEELMARFVNQPDVTGSSFQAKLARQLADAPDDAILLFAELMYLCLVPLWDYHTSTKRELVNSVLRLMQTPVELPHDLDEALSDKVFNGGVAFKSRRYFQLRYLCEFAHDFVNHTIDASLWDNPRRFRDHLTQTIATNAPSQQHSLLFLTFPDYFLPIVSENHRQHVLTTFGGRLDHADGDDDEDLRAILSALGVSPHGLYSDEMRSQWDPKYDDTLTPKAWLVRGSSVDGTNLASQWVANGYVSISAPKLQTFDHTIDRAELEEAVAAGFGALSYAAQATKVDELLRFLTRMHQEDVVVTTDHGRCYVGQVTSPTRLEDRSPATLQRNVRWAPEPIDQTELSDDARARLKGTTDVVEITRNLEEFRGFLPLSDDEEPIVNPTPELTLDDATDELADRLNMDRAWLQECIDLLKDKPQIIFYGPPGTGKTYIARALAEHLAGENVRLVQFHPAYSYEDFFEGYRPVESGGFTLRPGPLRKVVDKARENPATAYFLIIDEINRGNLAKIFGELYFLLEYRDENVELLYAADDDEGFTLPQNVFIIGTMNTSDRSIALVDAAMRRRFSFLALHPSEPPTSQVLRRWLQANNHSSEAADLLDELNSRIEDSDFKVGPSYFMGKTPPSPHRIERVWRTAILPLLEEHHYGEGLDVHERYGLKKIRQAVRTAEAAGGTDDPH